jgi:hypothetical protein
MNFTVSDISPAITSRFLSLCQLSVGCPEYVNTILHVHVFFIQNTWNECMLRDHVHLSLLLCVSQIFMKCDIWETALQVSVNYV